MIPVPVQSCLHLKTACTPLDEETLLVNSEWIDISPIRKFRFLHIPAEERFGANVLRLPQGILGNAAYPKTLDLIAQQRYPVRAVDLSEFAKAEGGVTCLSLILN